MQLYPPPVAARLPGRPSARSRWPLTATRRELTTLLGHERGDAATPRPGATVAHLVALERLLALDGPDVLSGPERTTIECLLDDLYREAASAPELDRDTDSA